MRAARRTTNNQPHAHGLDVGPVASAHIGGADPAVRHAIAHAGRPLAVHAVHHLEDLDASRHGIAQTLPARRRVGLVILLGAIKLGLVLVRRDPEDAHAQLGLVIRKGHAVAATGLHAAVAATLLARLGGVARAIEPNRQAVTAVDPTAAGLANFTLSGGNFGVVKPQDRTRLGIRATHTQVERIGQRAPRQAGVAFLGHGSGVARVVDGLADQLERKACGVVEALRGVHRTFAGRVDRIQRHGRHGDHQHEDDGDQQLDQGQAALPAGGDRPHGHGVAPGGGVPT